MTKNNQSRGNIHNIISFTCIGFLLFILGEIIVRAFITFPVSSVPDRELGWLRKPNSVFFYTKEGRAINTFNSMGFNDDEVSEVQSKNNILLVLGDSFTEALQVPKSKNFTSIVENQANCVDVFNGGRADLSPIQYHVVANRLSKVLSPNAIILTINYGDIDDINSNDAEIVRDPNNGNIQNIILKEKKLHWLRIKVDYISSKSALITFLGRRLKAIDLNLDRTDSLDTTAIISDRKEREDYYKIQDILEYELDVIESIAPLYVLYIPALEYQPNGKSFSTIKSEEFELMIAETTSKKKIPFLSVKKHMQEIYQKTKKPPVGFSNNNILTGHLNEIGHQTVASALLELLDIKCIDRV